MMTIELYSDPWRDVQIAREDSSMPAMLMYVNLYTVNIRIWTANIFIALFQTL